VRWAGFPTCSNWGAVSNRPFSVKLTPMGFPALGDNSYFTIINEIGIVSIPEKMNICATKDTIFGDFKLKLGKAKTLTLKLILSSYLLPPTLCLTQGQLTLSFNN
jgi:hypothetical protein